MNFRLRRDRHDFPINLFALFVFGDFQVVLGLQVHPGLRGHAEQATQAHRGVGGDGAVAGANFVYTALGNIGEFCDFVTGKLHRFDEVMQQDFARMDGGQLLAADDVAEFQGVQFCALDTHAILLVIVNDSYIRRLAVLPAETYTPLVVDADAPLPGAVAAQLLQTVAGRDAQFLDPADGINELELATGNHLDFLRKATHVQTVKHRCRGFVGEGLNHEWMLLLRGSIVNRY